MKKLPASQYDILRSKGIEYITLLQEEDMGKRLKMQERMCALRDYIACEMQQEAEYIQNLFEAIARLRKRKWLD